MTTDIRRASPQDGQNVQNGQNVPLRKENYTTYLYIGFAVVVAVLTVVGFAII